MTIESDFEKFRHSREETSPESVQQIREVVDAIFTADNGKIGGMRLRGVYKAHQIVPLVRAFAYAQKFQSRLGQAACEYVTELTVGQDGIGRDNVTEVMKAMLAGMQAAPEEPERRGLMARLLGR